MQATSSNASGTYPILERVLVVAYGDIDKVGYAGNTVGSRGLGLSNLDDPPSEVGISLPSNNGTGVRHHDTYAAPDTDAGSSDHDAAARRQQEAAPARREAT